MPSYIYHDEMEEWIEEAQRVLALLREADRASAIQRLLDSMGPSEQPKNPTQD